MFLVDLPTFAKVCSLRDADAAAAYLILAAGTGPDNRTSTWSAEAINRRTALDWRKARNAMEKLEQAGLMRWLSGKGTRKPRIDLPPVETRPAMQPHVADVFALVARGCQPTLAKEKGAATIGERQGWLARDPSGALVAVPERAVEMAFLPMELVGDAFGVASDASATTVVDRIRMSRDPMALRLLVDLYALQDLAEHGGVNRFWLEAKFKRGETEAAMGATVVWTFAYNGLSARIGSRESLLHHHWREPTAEEEEKGFNGARDFYERVQILDDAGALEWAYHLAEDETEGATMLYPVGVKRHGKMIWAELESIIGGYAIRAACAIGGYPNQAADWESGAPNRFILPADRLARKAALVGVPRLRHRARTLNAARWRKDLVDTASSHRDVFRGVIAERAPELLAEADRRLADFNVEFKEASTTFQRDINDTLQSGTHSPASNEAGAETEFRQRTPVRF